MGLPNSGKSSLFNALTGASTVVAPHPFSTTETAVALAHVPDERVDRLGKMSNSKKLVYTGFEIVDIAALVKGASTGEGLGNRFLGSLRDCDAVLYVLRAFEDPSVPGDTESRAWTFRAGAKAPECAGVIHSDLQRGFIRAEVISWQDLLDIGSWAKAKEQGKLRVEGKDYEVVDGDVLEIRFNV